MKRVTPLKLAVVATGRPQKDIAAELGIDEARFSRIVNGMHVGEGTRQAIADKLGRHIDDLFPGYNQQAA